MSPIEKAAAAPAPAQLLPPKSNERRLSVKPDSVPMMNVVPPSDPSPRPIAATGSAISADTPTNSTVRLIPQLKTEVIFKEPDPKPRISMEEAR